MLSIFIKQTVLLSSLMVLTAIANEMSAQAKPVLAQRESQSEQTPRYRSYIGIGGNIGLRGDDNAIGDGGFAILGKTGFTENLSLHRATIFGNTIGTYSLTYSFPIKDKSAERVIAIPFVDPGLTLRSEDDLNVDFLLSGDIDIPISSDLTGTVRVNTNFQGDPEVGLLMGIGYNFRIFDLFK